MSDPVILRSAADLSLEVLEEIAWEGRQAALHVDLLHHLAASHAEMRKALASGEQVYGVTTGMGYLAGVELDEAEQASHQANLLLGRAVGGPPFLESAEARAVLVARLASFLGGQAGVTPSLCTFLVDRLNDGFVPAIPRSAIGCAGEIIPLAHAFGPFIGVGQVLAGHDEVEDAAATLAARGVEPYQPAVKEGIALLAGAPDAVALAAAARRRGQALYRQLLLAAACAIDAMRAPLSPYDAAVARLANDPLMDDVLAALGNLLRGSDPERHTVQAPVSFRVIPQVLTQLARTLGRLEDDLRRSLTAVGDSPALSDPRGESGSFVTNGGFHAVGLASALDYLCIALIQAAELAGQQSHRLLDTRFTGLPDQLTRRPGPRAGLVAVQKRVVGSLNELRRLATPATVGQADTSMGQEDAMAFTFEAAEKLRRAESLVRDVIACELLTCRQAWALRSRAVAAGLANHARIIAEAVPPIDEDRPLGADIAALQALLVSEALQLSYPSV
jgi:histidine ammonia-lyase